MCYVSEKKDVDLSVIKNLVKKKYEEIKDNITESKLYSYEISIEKI